ncbi:MAG: hypothetical protein FWE09_01965, partial [Treponema sp.]|nr:hypothetical protein [Treponema sp.]
MRALALSAALAIFAAPALRAEEDGSLEDESALEDESSLDGERPLEGLREGFFLTGAFVWPFLTGAEADHLRALPGGKLGAGYGSSWGLDVALEAGFTWLSGIGPLAEGFAMIPITLSVGYGLPNLGNWGLRGELGAGFAFLRGSFFENALSAWTGDSTNESQLAPLAAARIYVTYRLPSGFSLYGGGGIDLLFESSMRLLMPAAQAGIVFRPLATREKASPPEPAYEPPPEAPPETPQETETPPAAPPGLQRSIAMVHFMPNLPIPIPPYRPALAEVAMILREDPRARLILRGYTANYDTPEERLALSEARASLIRDELARDYGVDLRRVSMEFFGADR